MRCSPTRKIAPGGAREGAQSRMATSMPSRSRSTTSCVALMRTSTFGWTQRKRVKERCRAAASKPRRNSSGGRLRSGLAMRHAHGENAPFSFEERPGKRHSACTRVIPQQEKAMQLQLKEPVIALEPGQVVTLDD